MTSRKTFNNSLLPIGLLLLMFSCGCMHAQYSTATDENPQLLGALYRFQKNYSAAVKEYERAIQADPTNVLLRIEKMQCHFAANDLRNACATLSAAIDEFPGDYRLYFLRGSVYNAMHDYRSAIADFDNVLAMLEPHIDMNITERHIQNKEDSLRKQHARIHRLLSHRVTDTSMYFDIRDYQDQFDEILQEKKIHLQNLAYLQTVLERAIALHQLRQYDQAIEAYSQCLALQPDNPSAYMGRALAAVQITVGNDRQDASLRDYDIVSLSNDKKRMAVDDLTRCLAICPDLNDCYLYRGLLYYSFARYELTVDDITRYIETVDDDEIYMETALWIRSQAYISMGAHQQAITDLSAILQNQPDNVYARYLRGCLYNRLADSRAITDLEQAVKDGYTGPDIYLEIGNARLHKADYAQALKHFQRVIDEDPMCCRAYTNAGYCYFVLGLHARALKMLDTAIRIDNNFINSYYYRSFVYKGIQEYQKAIGDLDAIDAIDPQQKQKTDYYRAVIYEKTGQTQRARELLKHCGSGQHKTAPVVPPSDTPAVAGISEGL